MNFTKMSQCDDFKSTEALSVWNLKQNGITCVILESKHHYFAFPFNCWNFLP